MPNNFLSIMAMDGNNVITLEQHHDSISFKSCRLMLRYSMIKAIDYQRTSLCLDCLKMTLKSRTFYYCIENLTTISLIFNSSYSSTFPPVQRSRSFTSCCSRCSSCSNWFPEFSWIDFLELLITHISKFVQSKYMSRREMSLGVFLQYIPQIFSEVLEPLFCLLKMLVHLSLLLFP